MSDPILEVKNLKKYFKTSSGMVHAVDDCTFSIQRGRTLGVVGESGCGKSTTGRCIVRLIEPTSGEILYDHQDINKMNRHQLKRIRKDMQFIFQDPYYSLNPRNTVYQSIAAPIKLNKLMPGATKSQMEERVLELMDTVGLAERMINSYPHELDGGRRQRIGIARALAMDPQFIVCDEPVSALDVSIQAQILNLLKELQEKKNLTYMFITHDLSVVKYFSDDIVVMYLGQIVEKAPATKLFENPLHPYTQALLSAELLPVVGGSKKRIQLTGEISSPLDPPDECRFAKRCPRHCRDCDCGMPGLVEIEPEHFAACHCIGDLQFGKYHTQYKGDF